MKIDGTLPAVQYMLFKVYLLSCGLGFMSSEVCLFFIDNIFLVLGRCSWLGGRPDLSVLDGYRCCGS